MRCLSFPSADRFKPSWHATGRLTVLATVAASCLAAFSSRAEEANIDLATLKVSLPAGATSEVTKDELDDVPIIKMVLPEGEFEAWHGGMKLELAPPAAGNYTLVFHAKAEPGECYIETRVYDFVSKPNREVVKPKSYRLDTDWQEYVYDFTIENSETGALTIMWGSLARQGKTIYFRDVKLIKN